VNNERAGRAGTGQQRLQRGPDLAGGRDRRASFEHVALHVNEKERGSHGSILARARCHAIICPVHVPRLRQPVSQARERTTLPR